MKTPQRAALERHSVARARPTDGPFAETKELIGGGPFTHAHPHDGATVVAARNLCLICGRQFDARVLECSASGQLTPRTSRCSGAASRRC